MFYHHFVCSSFTCHCQQQLVQLIVSQSDLDLEVQRYRMKKNTLTVNAIILKD